jgi:hypothetical protein
VTANTTSVFDSSRRSDHNNVSAISGHSTLPGRSKAAAYNHYGKSDLLCFLIFITV